MQGCRMEVVSWLKDTCSVFILCCHWWQFARDFYIIIGGRCLYLQLWIQLNGIYTQSGISGIQQEYSLGTRCVMRQEWLSQ